KGNIWLDAEKTSPYLFYQFWLNAADADAEKWIRIFTFLSRDQIETLIKSHHDYPEARELQRMLAKEITILVHGEDEWKKALDQTEKLFANQSAPAESLSESDLLSLEGIVQSDFDLRQLQQGVDIVSFLAASGILPSKGEARKMVQQGGISINRKKIDSPKFAIDSSLLLHEKYLLVQKGRKNYFLVKAVGG
ncbi:MAG TPA: S4 domain-containing protein, partial [Puia sp.]|nr:S4 domain-containing protein [Puia sp.]